MIQSFLQSMVAYCVILSPIYILFRLVVMRNKTKCTIREISMFAFFLYWVSIFSQTIIPKFSIIDRDINVYFEKAYVSSNFVPFETITLYMNQLQGPLAEIAFYNLAGNIVLFVPFGLFIPFLWRRLNGPFKMWIVALMIPLFIEGTQYFIGRSVDVDDVILNTAAIYLGYALFMVLFKLTNILKKEAI